MTDEPRLFMLTRGALIAALYHPKVITAMQRVEDQRGGLEDVADAILAALGGGEAPEFLTPSEVAVIFRVDPKTVTRWAAKGRLAAARTPGGHRRFRREDVMKFYLARGGAS